MAHTYVQMLTHIVFSSKHRAPFIRPEVKPLLYPYMAGIIRQLDGNAFLINGIEDHVHILASLPSTITLADFMRELKAGSSGWVNDALNPREKFGWQTGYAAFSVSKSTAASVERYIENQEEHHRKRTFMEEYVALLERHGISYDPRFVFD